MGKNDEDLELIIPCREVAPNFHISRIGLGAVKIGRTQALKYPLPFHLPSETDIAALLHHASSKGINWFDTATAYGSANRRLGDVRSSWTNFKVCLKIGERFSGDTSHYDFSPRALNDDLQLGMEQLRVSHIDILLLHLPSGPLEADAYALGKGSLIDFQRQKLVTLIGASVHSEEIAQRAMDDLDVTMLNMNLGFTALCEFASSARTNSILVKKALGGGHLLPPIGSYKVRDALRFCLSFESVASVVVGTLSRAHIDEFASTAATTE